MIIRLALALLGCLLAVPPAANAAASEGSTVSRFDFRSDMSVQCPNFVDEQIVLEGSMLVRAQAVTDETGTQKASFEIVRQGISGYGTLSGISYRITGGEHSVTMFNNLVTSHFRATV